MQLFRRLVSSAIVMMSIYVFSMSPLYTQVKTRLDGQREKLRMENVRVNGESFAELRAAVPRPPEVGTFFRASPAEENIPVAEEQTEPLPAANGVIVPTTIEGGLTIKNQTS